MTRVDSALRTARAAGVDRLDAQCLLAWRLQQPRAWLLAHEDAELDAGLVAVFADDCRRRAAGEPLAYLIGEREFHGLMLQVTPAVLVPRPETEGLVDWALELLAGALVGDFDGADIATRTAGPAVEIADLGTGSGAIAITLAVALAHAQPKPRICATDLSPDALAVARANAARHGADVEFLAGDWWQPLAGRQFDLVLSNPPYIAGADPHLAALQHEPRQALTPGRDGLGAIERIVGGAGGRLRTGGWLLIEHGHDQGPALRQLLVANGFVNVTTRTDLAGLPRCSGGKWPG